MIFVTILFALFAISSALEEGHIIGGGDSDIANYPWVVSIQFFGIHECTGFLINSRSSQLTYALTSATCFGGLEEDLQDWTVSVGSTDWHFGTIYSISSILLHPDYGWYAPDPVRAIFSANDIAIVELSAPVTESNTAPATLADAGADFDNQRCCIVGWGPTDNSDFNNGRPVDILQQGCYTVQTEQVCNNTYNSLENVTFPILSDISPDQMCAMDVTNNPPRIAACGQDKGMPLNCGGSSNIVAGIMSMQPEEDRVGGNICHPEAPGLYTRVSQYRQWITDNTP